MPCPSEAQGLRGQVSVAAWPVNSAARLTSSSPAVALAVSLALGDDQSRHWLFQTAFWEVILGCKEAAWGWAPQRRVVCKAAPCREDGDSSSCAADCPPLLHRPEPFQLTAKHPELSYLTMQQLCSVPPVAGR